MIAKTKLMVFYHAATIGAAFAASYFIAAKAPNNLLLSIAFILGAACYLLIRLSYKQGTRSDNLLFRAYRLINWCVPVVLFIMNFYLLLEGVEEQNFIPYKSFEELSFLGIFALAIWPVSLLIFLIGNTVIGITKVFLILQLPMTIAMSAVLLIMLYLAFKRLYQLKQSCEINFSIPLAALRAITPILLSTYLLIEIVPKYIL